ncbi:MAG: hypothetical protein ACJ8FU_08595 [Xanthobacteraceae bacterium]
MDDIEASLRAWTKDRLEQGETPFTIARHMMLAAAALLAIHEKLADQEPETEPEPETMPWQGWGR